MAEIIRVRNKNTGAIAGLPENALQHFSDWEPADGPVPDKPKPKSNPAAVSTASTEKKE